MSEEETQLLCVCCGSSDLQVIRRSFLSDPYGQMKCREESVCKYCHADKIYQERDVTDEEKDHFLRVSICGSDKKYIIPLYGGEP